MRTHMPLGGPDLEAAIRVTPAIRPYLIDSFILEESSILVVSPHGQGKTSIVYTVLIQGSGGQPVFGHLACARPLRFYVFCPERRATELKERLRKALDLGIPFNINNIYIDDGMTGMTDFCLPESCASIIAGVNHARAGCFKGQNPDILIIEGLYAMSAKSMQDPEFARGLMSFNTMVHRDYRASVYYSSHTKKQQRTFKGDLMDLDFLGGILIPANVTGFYLFERLPTLNKSHMTQKKDTVSGLANELAFTYDPETGLLTLDSDSPQVKVAEKFRIYINECLRGNRTFTNADLVFIGGGVSQSTVSRAISDYLKVGAILKVSPPGPSPGVYKVLNLV